MNISGAPGERWNRCVVTAFSLYLTSVLAVLAAEPEPVPSGDTNISLTDTNVPAPAAATEPAGSNTTVTLTATNTLPGETNITVVGTNLTAARLTKASNLSTFRTRPGFKIEVVASDPVVTSPVAMAFDEDGRLFVAELRAPEEGLTRGPYGGRIRVLEDPNGEGVFTSSTLFATNLPMPSALICYGGGVFVVSAPDVLFLQDTDTNGVADVRRVVLTGIGTTNTIHPDRLPTSLYWGLDNRIYCGSGGAVGLLNVPGGNPAQGLPLAGKDFSFDPRSLSFRTETGPSLSGAGRDDWGHRYITGPSRPLQVEVIPDRFIEANLFAAPPRGLTDLSTPAIAVFQHSTGTTNASPALRNTNGVAPAWMTRARGTVVYRGGLFPTNYSGNIFVAEPEAHVVHRELVIEDGYGMRAERASDERAAEFLISSDSTFEPTQVACGPDGALYIADNVTGGESGRIYRVSPSGYKPSKPAKLSAATTLELVTALASTNGWVRDTAARLLFERRDTAAVPLLTSMAQNSRVPLARVQALYALAGMGVLNDLQTAAAMSDPDARVRRHAAALAEGFVREGNVPENIWTRLRAQATDINAEVRLQSVLTSQAIARPEKAMLLRDAFVRDADNPWMQTAVLVSSLNSAGALVPLINDDTRVNEDLKGNFVRRLVEMIGTSGSLSEVSAVLNFITGPNLPPAAGMALTGALGEGLNRTRSSLRLVDTAGGLQRMFALALTVAADRNAPLVYRLDAIRVLGVGPYTMNDGGAVLARIIGSAEPVPVQAAALRAFANYVSAEVPTTLLRKWVGIPVELRNLAVDTMMTRTDQIPAVLTLIETGQFPSRDVAAWQANVFLTWPEPAVRQRAAAIFGQLTQNRTPALAALSPALKLTGAPARGATIFQARCSGCHTIDAPSVLPGPELGGVKAYGKLGIYENILDPNARILPGYQTLVLSTHTGETHVGTLLQENAEVLVLKTPGRAPVAWPKLNLTGFQVETWSMMPPGIEEGLTAQNIADLLQYLLTVR